MKQLDLTNVQEAGNQSKLPAGGYVCRYTKVEDVPGREYLYMEYDIAEGEYKGYYANLEENLKFWGGRVYRSYKERALPMFKRMCDAVSKSNPGFVFDGGQQNANEKTLEGKCVGLILGEEEYIGNDGSMKTRLYVHNERNIADIKSGNFKVPEIKKLKSVAQPTAAKETGFMKLPDSCGEEFPFH